MVELNVVDPFAHYKGTVEYFENEHLNECPMQMRRVGWSLGNECPFRCNHCYSMSARRKGADLTKEIVDRITSQLAENSIEGVTLGGNEPIFTNGKNVKNSLLPYIIERLEEYGIKKCLITSGVSATYLEKHFPKAFAQLDHVAVSFDSPIEAEHNENRGAKLYQVALQTLDLCERYNIPKTIIMCGMNWNFTPDRLKLFVDLGRQHKAFVRVNPIKPVAPDHQKVKLSASQYYQGFRYLLEVCDSYEIGEPPLAMAVGTAHGKGCPCGRSTFRIHSITPDGKVPVSPCIYLHDFKFGNLIKDELSSILVSPPFRAFRRRYANPDAIDGSVDTLRTACGGCTARSYLHHLFSTGEKSLFKQDPLLKIQSGFPHVQLMHSNEVTIHQDYMCTWIGKPR